ncbi:MAG: hypothetical protein R3E53_02875 [Myxococcota bacterium]
MGFLERPPGGSRRAASSRRTPTSRRAFGGGVDFTTRHVGLSLDTSYVLPVGDVEDLDYVSVGAGVFFRLSRARGAAAQAPLLCGA